MHNPYANNSKQLARQNIYAKKTTELSKKENGKEKWTKAKPCCFLGQATMGSMHDSSAHSVGKNEQSQTLLLPASWAKQRWAAMTDGITGPTLGCLQALKTGISRGNFPEKIRDPLIRSGNYSNRFRSRIRRIFPDFFPNPFYPEKMISGREFRYSVSVGTGISRSRFHP